MIGERLLPGASSYRPRRSARAEQPPTGRRFHCSRAGRGRRIRPTPRRRCSPSRSPYSVAVIAAALVAVALGLPPHGWSFPAQLRRNEAGATRPQGPVRVGPRYGRCRNCRQTTWYFTYKDFQPQGGRVAFQADGAVSYFNDLVTAGLAHEPRLKIGDSEIKIASIYGVLPRVECGTYTAFVLRRGGIDTQVLQPQEGGLGLRDQPGWGSTVPLASRSRFISEATSGIAASTGSRRPARAPRNPASPSGTATSRRSSRLRRAADEQAHALGRGRETRDRAAVLGRHQLEEHAHASVITVPPRSRRGRISP